MSASGIIVQSRWSSKSGLLWERSQQPTLFWLLVPKRTGHEAAKNEATTEKRKAKSQKELFDKIYVTGLGEWSQNEQKEAWELIIEYTGIFSLRDMDLGKTSLVKHRIRLTDNTTIKEHYWWILPSMYEEVRELLTQMLEINALWPSHSPWASLVVLVCKKDVKLWFCIDLRKLNVYIW